MNKKYKLVGICSNGNCNRVQDSIFKQCTPCRQATSERRFARVAEGLCRYCSNLARPNTNSCESCANSRKIRTRGNRKSLKEDVINHYGGKCACCGEAEPKFMTIDHIDGGGYRHRKTIAKGGDVNAGGFYLWLKNKRFPDGFQVLCWNCNCAKGVFGICPHQATDKSGTV